MGDFPTGVKKAMTKPKFDSSLALDSLKDFQRRTVDYVSNRFYGRGHTDRFLVADEVGLGKTMVARGIIARMLERSLGKGDRIDIVYVCSNATIARQNREKLNVLKGHTFAQCDRITMLPAMASQLSRSVNFLSVTPGTTFRHSQNLGTSRERALIYKMLRQDFSGFGQGFLNMLQGAVRTRERWKSLVQPDGVRLDRNISAQFRSEVNKSRRLRGRLERCCEKFRTYRPLDKITLEDSSLRAELVGELRTLLARVCMSSLSPKLVILDEFQRFKDLLSSDHEAGGLANLLFKDPDCRILLLSATPYKMLTVEQDVEEDHYKDFTQTLEFLFGKDKKGDLDAVKTDIQIFRKGLMRSTEDVGEKAKNAKDRLQARLLKVMCRTERVARSKNRDAMLKEDACKTDFKTEDLAQAKLVSIADAPNMIEYWKSAPYLLNFMKKYQLRKRLDNKRTSPEVSANLRKSRKQLLQIDNIRNFKKIDNPSPRMRYLFRDLFQEDLSQGLWQMLWLPPSMLYTRPTGHFNAGPATKSLIFSSWNMVPDTIASLCSYEAERLMLGSNRSNYSYEGVANSLRPALRFYRNAKDRLPAGMMSLAWLLPSPKLAACIDPLEATLRLGNGKPITISALKKDAIATCKKLLGQLKKGDQRKAIDRRWYWAAIAMLDRQSGMAGWCASKDGLKSIYAEGSDGETAANFIDHVDLFTQAIEGDDQIQLGKQPPDLAEVLAELALSGPGTCALRSLMRVSQEPMTDEPEILTAATEIAMGFRAMFNLPTSTSLVRRISVKGGHWRKVLRYSLEGNLQSLLDEQIHLLSEAQSSVDETALERARKISKALSGSLTLRTRNISVDEYKFGRASHSTKDFTMRGRFAMRFGNLKNDGDAEPESADRVRTAFNSPFRPFVLASTSIGQEGLDFHSWCHRVVHWNLPANPVDLEQREGRVHRYKGHAIRKNIAEKFGLKGLLNWNRHDAPDPWSHLFRKAADERAEGTNDLVPYWVFDEGSFKIERKIPMLPFSKEVQRLEALKSSLALYRLVFGQPRQEELLAYLHEAMPNEKVEEFVKELAISLEPP